MENIRKAKTPKYLIPRFRLELVRDPHGFVAQETCDKKVAAEAFHSVMDDLPYETVWIITVNARARMMGMVKVGQGGIHATALLARDILTPACAAAASGLILGHSHPSGDPSPSREDIDLTKSLQAACGIVCIPLIDHIIIAEGCEVSMFERGLM